MEESKEESKDESKEESNEDADDNNIIKKKYKIKKNKPIPYTCVRCNYQTNEKYRMRDHLYNRKKPCPIYKIDIELTDYIREKIMINRKYIISKEEKKQISSCSTIVKNIKYNYLYLLRPRENTYNNNNIYKLGSTILDEPTINLPRITSYGVGTELILIIECINAKVLEQIVKKEFNKIFDKPYGTEYFIGDKRDMVKIITEFVNNEQYDSIIKYNSKNDEILFDDEDDKILFDDKDDKILFDDEDDDENDEADEDNEDNISLSIINNKFAKILNINNKSLNF